MHAHYSIWNLVSFGFQNICRATPLLLSVELSQHASSNLTLGSEARVEQLPLDLNKFKIKVERISHIVMLSIDIASVIIPPIALDFGLSYLLFFIMSCFSSSVVAKDRSQNRSARRTEKRERENRGSRSGCE